MRIILIFIILLLLLPAPAAHAQAVVRCTQALADPPVAEPAADSPWRQLRPTRQFTSAQSRSAPQSIALLGATGLGPITGQVVGVPPSARELYGTFYARFPSGLAANAAIRLSIYSGDSIDPADAVFSADFANDGPANTWRRFDWELTDLDAVVPLREAETATIALELLNVGSSTVWLDDLTANVCSPAARLSGAVTNSADPAADLAGATVLLARSNAAGTSVIAVTRSDATGAYSFSGVPALATGETYQIWFTNTPADADRPADRLGFLAGPVLSALADGEQRTGLDLAINDIRLDAPAPNAAVVASNSAPVTLRWSGRAEAGERHQVCLYDPLRIDPATQAPPELCSSLRDPATETLSFDLTPASFAAAPNLGFAYGRTYRWYVRVVGPATDAQQPQRSGRSFFERSITLLPRPAAAPPSTPVAADPGPPDAAPSTAQWTLLVYAALDNAMSDANRTPGTNRADLWVNRLRNLATQHPNVRIVTLLDRYGSTGVEWCYLPPNTAPDCRVRPEANSADPAVFTAFVQQGLQRYPAQRAALLMLGPGHAVGGFGVDETSPSTPALTPTDLATALNNATEAADRRLDLVVAQAPLMAEIDLAASLAPAADYLIATPDQIWQVNLFPGLLALLSGAQSADPRGIAAELTTTYASAVNNAARGRALSMQALDLRNAAATLAAREALAAELRAALVADETTTRNLIDAARRAAQPYDASGNGRLSALADAAGASVSADEDAFVDLDTFAARLADEPIAPEVVRNAAAELRAQLAAADSLLIAVRTQNGLSVAGVPIDLARARSPALFLPPAARLGNQPTLSALRLHRDVASGAEWNALLRDLRAGELPGNGPAAVLAIAPNQPGIILPTGGLIGGTTVYLPIVRR